MDDDWGYPFISRNLHIKNVPPLLFRLSILSEVWLLNFLRSYSQIDKIHTYQKSLVPGRFIDVVISYPHKLSTSAHRWSSPVAGRRRTLSASPWATTLARSPLRPCRRLRPSPSPSRASWNQVGMGWFLVEKIITWTWHWLIDIDMWCLKGHLFFGQLNWLWHIMNISLILTELAARVRRTSIRKGTVNHTFPPPWITDKRCKGCLPCSKVACPKIHKQ